MDCDVYWAHTRSVGDRHLAVLDQTELARRRVYKRRADQDRFALGAALLRMVAAERCSVAPEAIDIDRSCPACGRPHGKPRVRDSRLEFSVAHSGDYVAVAATSAGPVGVDVETVRPLAYAGLLDHVCAAEEHIAEASLADFYTYWTRKESLLKAAGVGLTIPMTSLVVTAPAEAPRLLRAPDGFPAVAAIADVSPAGGYAGAVSVLTDAPVRLRVHHVPG